MLVSSSKTIFWSSKSDLADGSCVFNASLTASRELPLKVGANERIDELVWRCVLGYDQEDVME